MKLSSLRRRLLLAAAVFILTATALASLALTLLFERHVTQWIDGELNVQLDQLIAGIDRGPNDQLAVMRPPGDPRFARPLSGLYWKVVIEPSGPTYHSRSLWDFEISLPGETRIDDRIHHYRVEGPGGGALYLLQKRVELPTRLGRKTARVAVALEAAQVSAAVWKFATALTPFLLLIAALFTAAAWAQVRVGLRPLDTIRDRLAAIGSGRETRLGAGFPDELQPLVNEMDALLAAREHQIEKSRGRAADLAHGLKTPLQVLAGDVQRLKAKGETIIAADIEKVALAMQNHVGRELVRARMAGPDSSATSDVGVVVESVVRVVKRTADGARLVWSVEAGVLPKARIDPADLAEALGALIENAARHARSRVVLTAAKARNIIEISICDDGPGIPKDQRSNALERGRRLDTTTGGAGLGLSIAADILESINGGIRMSDSPDNPSLFCVTLWMPMAASSALDNGRR